jgi:RimJ/RimL family protein N-acetyltransferase
MDSDHELLTERLALRRPVPSDVDAIFAIHHDPRASAHNPSDALATRGEAEALFSRWDEHWRVHGYGYWVVRDRESPDVLGFCGLKNMRLHDRRVLNLFYRLAPSAWGQGIASEAATAAVDWARTHLPDEPIIARVRPDNVASARVALRAGLVRAEHLDGPGYDGFDLIYVSTWL